MPSPVLARPVGSPAGGRASDRTRLTAQLLERAQTAEDDATYDQLIESVVVLNMDAAEKVTLRYQNRGVPDDDLRQVAFLGLTMAARRFDPERATPSGHGFLAFAIPTIRGELRKYFRDHAWMVRPTRRIQELQPRITGAREELQPRLGRSPLPGEIAARLGEPEDLVIEALASDGCFRPTSLDLPVSQDGIALTLGELVGDEHRGWESVEARLMLGRAVAGLSERDRDIVFMRFFKRCTQAEIADELGVTQTQVSRLLTRILRDLRDVIGEVDEAAPDARGPRGADIHPDGAMPELGDERFDCLDVLSGA